MTSDARFDESTLPRLKTVIGPAALGEVLDLYMENSPKRIATVRDGLKTGDLAAAARALHDIKSSAGMIGAAGLQRLALEMEQLARDADANGLQERFARLEAASKQAEDWLAALRQRNET